MRTLAATLAALLLAPAVLHAQGYAPDVAASKMSPADGLAATLYASEPDVRQPILVKFDDRGRLWTIQYLQYPNPAGLKRVKVDRWSRTVYDRVPEPPPKGPRGADKLTICEDSDGDGRADRFKDFVDGLNLATGLEFGHGGVYVLQVPYLLFYPDRDRDDTPDDSPEVLLSGFGMDDAQSLVNHLTWGPDGWLYGVTGSTSNNVVRGLEFQQAVWRFHPRTRAFELFCEGGGNLFGLTFDPDGNLIFSSNGNDLAYHAVQGGYYRKNFGKHGPLHNPYTYGFFEHLPYDRPVGGPRPGGTIYTGTALPEKYRGAYLCCEFLQHSAASWRLTRKGSTFAAEFIGTVLDGRDTWFCPPDLCQGPDGAVYLCDFHDRRTAHPDPDAQWDRSNGRVYRLAPPGTPSIKGLDMAQKTNAELFAAIVQPNGWYADRARVELASRHDPDSWSVLRKIARREEPRIALQGLWALHVSGGLDEPTTVELLKHPGENVRAWTIRLLADDHKALPAFAELAASDPSVVVRLQLAASARRLPGEAGWGVLQALLKRGLDHDDPYVPLMVWWAVEARAASETERLVAFFDDNEAWSNPLRRETGLKLIRRLAAEGTATSYDAAARLLAKAPVADGLAALDSGLAERGAVVSGGMGMVGLFDGLAVPHSAAPGPAARPFEPLSPKLVDAIALAFRTESGDLVRLRLALRAGLPTARYDARGEALAPGTTPARRRALLDVLARLGSNEEVPAALSLMNPRQPIEVQAAALDVIARHDDGRSTEALLGLYDSAAPALKSRLREVFLSRPVSARAFLDRVDRGKIPPTDVPLDQLRLVTLHADPVLDALVRKHWGRVQAGTPEERLAEVRRLSNDLRAGEGDRDRGKALFAKHCGACHKLHGEGGDVGPDLTGIARDDTASVLTSIVDPGAVVRAQYQPFAAVTKSGRIVTGLVVGQDDGVLTFVDAQAQRTSVPRAEVEEIRELPNSLMPDNLLAPLAPQEVRDLFRYLQQPPR